MDCSACTLDQGVSKAFYFFWETKALGSSECGWALSLASPGGGSCLVRRIALPGHFCGLTTPVVLVEAVEYAPVAPATRCSTATYWGWSGAKPETYTKQPWVALQLSRVSPSGGLAAGDLVYGLCCPLPVKLQTPLGTVPGLVAADPLQYERNCS